MWQLKVQTWQKCENILSTKENRRKFPTKFSKIRRIFSQHFSFEPYRAFFSSPGRARAWPVQNFRASSPKKARKNGSGRAEPTGRAGPDPPLLKRLFSLKARAEAIKKQKRKKKSLQIFCIISKYFVSFFPNIAKLNNFMNFVLSVSLFYIQ